MSSNKKNILKIIAAVGVIALIAVISLVACKQQGEKNEQAVVQENEVLENEKPSKNITKTVAVFGVDKDGYRPDVIFVVHFNSETNKAKVISVPRDTKVVWTEEQKDIVRKNDGYVVSRSKLNEMTSYGGIENIRELTVQYIEDMLDVPIDNYVVVNIDAFKQIVDAIGGVEVDVPQRMYYQDRSQGLYIDLYPGVQILDGDKAEQLIRFRKGYAEGDIGRIKTEQLFLEAFAAKVMSPEILKDLPKIVSILFKSVKTDVGIGEALGYYPYVKYFDVNNLSFHTLPGEPTYEPGAWYFIPDYVQMENFVREVFYELPPLPIDEETINAQREQRQTTQEAPSSNKKQHTQQQTEAVKPEPKPQEKPTVDVEVTSPSDPPTEQTEKPPTTEGITPPNEEVVPPTEEQVTPPVGGEGTLPPVEEQKPPTDNETQPQNPEPPVTDKPQVDEPPTTGENNFEVPQS